MYVYKELIITAARVALPPLSLKNKKFYFYFYFLFNILLGQEWKQTHKDNCNLPSQVKKTDWPTIIILGVFLSIVCYPLYAMNK